VKKVAARLLVLAMGFAVALVVCEVFVRVAKPQVRYITRDELPPSVRLPAGPYTSASPEWRARIEINPLGFHDREHAFERSGDELRVVVAGDSFSEAAQLPIEQVWWSLAGDQIQEELGRPVEVINCGMAGVGTATEWATYRKLGRRYEPDVVLLPIYLENDVIDNSHELQGEPDHGLYYELAGGLVRQIDLPPTSGRGESWLWKASHLVRFVGRMLFVRAEAAQRIAAGGGYPRDLQIYLEQPPEAWERAWALTEALIGGLRDQVVDDGALLVATVIPGKLQVHDEHWNALLEAYPPMGEQAWDTDGPRRRMVGILEDLGVTHLDLTPGLQAAAVGSGPLYFEADIHWTAEGNRVAGTATADLVVGALATAEPVTAEAPEHDTQGEPGVGTEPEEAE